MRPSVGNAALSLWEQFCIFNLAKRERVLFIWENAPVFVNSWILVRREHSVHFGECAEVAFWCIALRRHWRWCGHGRTQGADSQ